MTMIALASLGSEIFCLMQMPKCHVLRGGGEHLTKFNTGRLQPLTLLYTISAEKVPFYIPFIEKRYPFHISTLQHCTPFLSPWNEANEQYYGRNQALPEEMFSKQVLFIQFTLWAGVKLLRTSGAQTAIAFFVTFIKPFQCLLYLYRYVLFNER